MTFPSSEPIRPDQNQNSTSARRRRQGRIDRRDLEGEQGRLGSLAGLLTPSVDYYFGFLLTGLLAAAAMLIDAPALYVLAVLFAPFLGPVFGLPFAAVITSGKFLLKSIAHLLGGGAVVFSLGVLAGWIAVNMPADSHFNQVSLHSVFTWPDMTVLVVGAAFTIFLLVRSPRQKPLVANIAVAYELALPLASSGFYLVNNTSGSWTGALLVFTVHLAIAVFVSAVMLLLLGLRPSAFFGYAFLFAIIILGVAAIVIFASSSQASQTELATPPPKVQNSVTTPTPTRASTSTPQPVQTIDAALPVFTATSTLEPLSTPTSTVTFAPTPIWAKVDAPGGDGAFIREEPDGKIITSLLNGSPVTVLSEPLRVEGGAIWVKIQTEGGVVGWILQSLLATATPSPGW